MFIMFLCFLVPNATRKSQLSFCRAPLLFCGAAQDMIFQLKGYYAEINLLDPPNDEAWALLGHGGNRR